MGARGDAAAAGENFSTSAFIFAINIVDNLGAKLNFRGMSSDNVHRLGRAKPQAKVTAASRRRASKNAPSVSVEERLRGMIARQELPPGASVREEAIARLLAVSRSRVREALGVLEDRGLVVRIPNRGAIVSQLTFEEVLELFEVRISLESLCVRLAVLNTTPDSWLDLKALFGAPSEALIAAHDLDGYLKHIETFRARIIAAAGSRTLGHLLEIVADRDRALLRRTIILPERAEQGLLMQRAIIDAMAAGDAEGAENLKRESIIRARDAVIRYRNFIV